MKRLIALLAVASLSALGVSGCSEKGNIEAKASGVFPAVSQPDKESLRIDAGGAKPSAVDVRILRGAPSSQPVITKNDTVLAKYQGQTWDGTILETTYHPGWTPTPLQLDSMVVKGLKKGIVGHRVGELLQIVIPAKDAFGAKGRKDASGKQIVKPNTPLVYVVDLLDAANLHDDSAVKEAKPNPKASKLIPEGIHVEGAKGKEPTITVDPSYKPTNEVKVIVLDEGQGPAIGPDDYAAVRTVLAPIPVQSAAKGVRIKERKASSDWKSDQYKLTPDVVGTDRTFLGITVGTRALVIQPSSQLKDNGKTVIVPGAAMVIDYGARLSP